MIYLLIPSYNDSDNFSPLLRNIHQKLKSYRYKVIIVDDGSTDDTKRIIRQLAHNYPITWIGYKKNRGPGHAFKFGFNYIIPKLKQSDTLITMEADNSSDLSILKKMVRLAKKHDVVLSSPFASGGKFIKLEVKRRILSEISSLLDRCIFRIKGVKTYASFYRAYNPMILKNLLKIYKANLITENGFSSVVELLIKLSKLGGSIYEIPSTLDWSVRRGKSKMKIGKTIVRHLMIYRNYLLGKYSV